MPALARLRNLWKRMPACNSARARLRRRSSSLARIEALEDRTLLSGGSIWLSADQIMALPTSGPAWESVLVASKEDTSAPSIQDQDDRTDTYVLAKALVGVRLQDERLQSEVRSSVMAAIGTEDGGRTLALGRNLASYVIAADLVGLEAEQDAVFRDWLKDVLHEELDGRTLVSTHEDRPNNWGTMAGASRAAVAAYLDSRAMLDQTAQVFKGWLGDRDSYAEFDYGKDLSWQADPDNPVGINPLGATKEGYSIDGALPEEMRRGGSFEFPPEETDYPWEALQGAVVQAEILQRAGYNTWQWEDQALLRATEFLHVDLGWTAGGDDAWVPWLVDANYGTDFAQTLGEKPGKIMGWTSWTHQFGLDGQENQAPVVDAGVDRAAVVGTAIALDAAVYDDGLPNPPAAVAVAWSVVSGPGAVTFTDPSATDTEVSFDSTGTYVLQLAADDGELTAFDETVVRVDDASSLVMRSYRDGIGPDEGYFGTRDAQLNGKAPDTNFGTATELEVDGSPNDAALLRWDLDLPAGSRVHSAAITLYVTNSSSDTFELYSLSREWVESEVTWNVTADGIAWDAPGARGVGDRGAVVLGELAARSKGYVTVALNAAGLQVVQSWIDDPGSNFGLIVQDYETASDGTDFESRESAKAERRPMLTITYALSDSQPDNEPPTSSAGGPYKGTEDAALRFDASASFDPEAGPLTYIWDFGDGNQTTTSEATVTHSYAHGGDFSVKLTVRDEHGATATDTTSATVEEINDAPVADAGGPYTATVNEPVTFDASGSFDPDNRDGSDANDQPLTYIWDFGDGTGTTTSDATVTHTYAQAGTYTVTLVANDGVSRSEAATTTATVEAPPAEPAPTLFVSQIAFESRSRGRNNTTDLRILVTIRRDSDGDGEAELADEAVKDAFVRVRLMTPDGSALIVSGTTNGAGLFRTGWIRNLDAGTYTANVIEVTSDDWSWDFASPLNREDDSDGDGFPDALLTV